MSFGTNAAARIELGGLWGSHSPPAISKVRDRLLLTVVVENSTVTSYNLLGSKSSVL